MNIDQAAQSTEITMVPATGVMPDAMVAPVTEITSNPSTKDIQAALKNAGFYQGNIDGDIGPRTKKAIRAFQEANGLKVDGKVGPRTWAKLATYLRSQPAAAATAQPVAMPQ